MIFIVDIEAVETRYTAQWKKYLPKQLGRHTNQSVMTISGGNTPQATTPGAFLNFGGTNVYKSKQLEQIGQMFCDGEIIPSFAFERFKCFSTIFPEIPVSEPVSSITT